MESQLKSESRYLATGGKTKLIIWYINHYATPPDWGLPGRPYFLATSLAERGHRVINICSSWHHLRPQPAPRDEVGVIKKYAGIEYLQLPAMPYHGNGMARVINMVGFGTCLMRIKTMCQSSFLPKPDVIIPSCVHPFVFPPSYKLAKLFRAKLIYEVRDIWPLSLVELAAIPSWHPIVMWMNNIEQRAYTQSHAVVSLLPKAFEHMRSRGLAKDKFHYIPNGISVNEWNKKREALPAVHNTLFQQIRDRGKMIVLYAGAFGPPNALDQVLDLASISDNKNRPYHFIFIGDGVEKTKLTARISKEHIDFIDILPKISKPQAMTAMRMADVCFFSLRSSSIFRFGISPNKLADYLMAGKPIVSACDAGNDPVAEAKGGISVRPYSPVDLHQALLHLYGLTEEQRQQLGRNGRQYALSHLEWSVLARKYEVVINNIC